MDVKEREQIPEQSNLKACRIPPTLRRRIYISTTRAYSRIVHPPSGHGKLNCLIAVLALALLLTFSSMANYEQNIKAEYILTTGTPVDPNQSIVATTEECTPTSEVLLLNCTPFRSFEDWMTTEFNDTFTRWDWHPPMQFPRISTHDSNGCHFQLQHRGVSFYRVLSIPLPDYTQVVFSATVEVISGTANVGVRVEFGEYLGNPYEFPIIENHTSVGSGQLVTLSLKAPLTMLRTLTDLWSIQAEISLEVASDAECDVVVKDFTVSASSAEELVPVSVDIQTTDEESFFRNPYALWMFPTPLLTMTRNNGTEGVAVLQPRTVNQTFYLTHGEYNISAGWLESQSNFDQLQWFVNIELSIANNQGVSLRVKLVIIKLHITATPNLLADVIDLDDSDSNWRCSIWGLSNPLPECLYLPPFIEGFEIQHRVPRPWYTFDGAVCERKYIANPGLVNLQLDIRYPYYTVFGVSMDVHGVYIGSLFMLMVIALAFRFKASIRYLTWRTIWSDPRFLPVLLLLTSMFLPWLSFSEDLYGSKPFEVHTELRVLPPIYISHTEGHAIMAESWIWTGGGNRCHGFPCLDSLVLCHLTGG